MKIYNCEWTCWRDWSRPSQSRARKPRHVLYSRDHDLSPVHARKQQMTTATTSPSRSRITSGGVGLVHQGRTYTPKRPGLK
ncbi:hypothetical protein J6590_024194 [Homalodisca vitripennis]|nr:hypothetical protein J6590_024194 [Homalodisca vitripennis]